MGLGEEMGITEPAVLELDNLNRPAHYTRGLKTEIVMTANLREWRHFFTLRAAKAAHPQMRALAGDMLLGFRKAVPVIFDDIAAYNY